MWMCNKATNLTSFLVWFLIELTVADDESGLVYALAESYQIVVWQLTNNKTNRVHIQTEGSRLRSTIAAFTFDFEEKNMYWSSDRSNLIRGANIDGTSLETVLYVSNASISITGLAFDWITKNLYVANRQIRVCDLSRQFCAILVNDVEYYNPSQIALHPQSGTIVWTTNGPLGLFLPSAVFKAGMDGSDVTQIAAKEYAHFGNIVVDHALSHLYWVDRTNFRVLSSELNGTNLSDFKFMGNTSIQARSVAVLGQDIYWLDKNRDFIKKCNKIDGNLFEVIESNLNYIGEFYMMFLMGPGSQPNGRVNHCANHSCSHLCVLTKMSYRCMCPPGLLLLQDGENCKEYGPKMLISTTVGVHVLSMASLEMRRISNSSSSWGLSYDFQKSKIYWAGGYNGATIFRSGFNRSGIELVVTISGGLRITGLAYDWIAHNIYYANENHVGVCDERGASCAVLVHDSRYKPFRVVVSPRSGLLFVTAKGAFRSICRAFMDGSSFESIRIEWDEPSNLAIHHESSQLFWTDEHRMIVATDFNLKPLGYYSLSSPSKTRSVAVGGDLLYSADNHDICSCNKYRCPELKYLNKHNLNAGVFEMHLFHLDGQPNDRKNHCAGALCSHICVLTEKYFRCICPTGMYIMEDGRTCSELSRNQSFPPNPEDENGGHFGFNGSSKHWVCADGTLRSPADLCNGALGCPDGTDEGQYCNIPCIKINLTDDGKDCMRTPNGPQIVCPIGFLPAAHKASCEDVDECLEKTCEQDCINTYGSYQCRDFPEGSSDPLYVALSAGIPTILAILLIGIAVFFGVKYIQTRKILRRLTPEEVQEFFNGDENAAKTADSGADKAMLMPFRLILQPYHIIIAKDAILGSGQFGIVYRGFYEAEAVAVKTFKRTVEIDDFKAVLSEAKMMAYIGDHVNIVKFVGADVSAIADRKLVLVTELSPYGDLLGYLRKIESSKWLQQTNHSNRDSVTPAHMVRWCEEIACGMQYLELKKIVHGDLATRNVLVFKDNVVKITDFGLSKQLYGNAEYTMKRVRMLPWKWSALELLTRREFSTDSDIWALGVTAWEIFSLGRQPYDEHAFGPGFIDYLENGHRLPKPTYATNRMYAILKGCWNTERSSRPRFSVLREFFHEESTKAGLIMHIENLMASREDNGYTNL